MGTVYYRGSNPDQQRKSKNNDSNELLRGALEMHERFQWSLIPVVGKKAIGRWKRYQQERPTRGELEKVFAGPRITGIAVIHGPVSNGLVIRDFDEEGAYPEWVESHQSLSPILPTVRTGRGNHVYFRGPSLFEKLSDGEYRGTSKQYTLIPPSVHPSGRLYEWLIPPDGEIPWIDDPRAAGLLAFNQKSAVECTSTSTTLLTTLHTNRIKTCEVANYPSHLPEPEGEYGWRPTKKVRQFALIHQPTRIGERNSKILDYVRALQRLDVKWDRFRVKVAFHQWWMDAWQVVGTKDEAFSLHQFYDAWGYCPEEPPGLDYERLLKTSASEELPAVAERYPEKTRILLRACIHLQKLHGGKSFFLSCQDAGGLMDKGKETGQLVLRALVRDGLLEKLSTGNNFTGKASGYRYLGGTIIKV